MLVIVYGSVILPKYTILYHTTDEEFKRIKKTR